jgi:SNF family Na+-dependent transporter
MLYNNGGGVFFIPYFFCLVLIVYPIFFMEVAYGTAYKRLMDRLFEPINSKFIGVSFGINMILFLEAVLYMCLLGWCCNFFIFSFQTPLPWHIPESEAIDGKFWKENYFREEFLQVSTGLYDINKYVPWIMISFIIANAISFIAVVKGIDSVKYAVYVVIPLPYFILFILFAKGLFLEGNTIGWAFLFKADWDKLYTLQIWRDAAAQAIFSAGITTNAMIHFGAHRTDKKSILAPSIGIPTLNVLTSIFASISLFSFIGYISHKTGVSIEDMPIEGMELSFVIYPALLTTLPFANFWSVMFFLMLIAIGLSTNFAFIDPVATFIHEILLRYKWYNYSKVWITFSVTFMILVINLGIFATDAGYYWLKLLDHYTVGINLTIFFLIQIIIFAYCLPIEDLEQRVEDYGETFPTIYKLMIKYICPVVAVILVSFAILNEFIHPLEMSLAARLTAIVLVSLPGVL